jgi:hypothetical protein
MVYWSVISLDHFDPAKTGTAAVSKSFKGMTSGAPEQFLVNWHRKERSGAEEETKDYQTSHRGG